VLLIHGRRHRSGAAVVYVDHRRLSPKASLRVRRHSPTGFEWGYAGSGPAQLALGLLLRGGVPARQAVRLHQRFKAEFVQHFPPEGFLVELNIRAWAARQLAPRPS